MKTMLLCMDDVRSSLSMAAVIEAVEEGYLAFEEGKYSSPTSYQWRCRSITEKPTSNPAIML